MNPEVIKINENITNYLIYNDGRLFNRKTNRFLKGSITNNGYRAYQLTYRGKYYNFLAHRLVAEYFLENDLNLPIVHHIDGNRLNNNFNNLKWVSYSENSYEAYPRKVENKKCQKITQEELERYEWRLIKNSSYYISENGDVYNSNTGIKLRPKKDGYLRYTLVIEGKSTIIPAHILVYKAFIKEEIINEIDHIDGNKMNNHYTNLRDITHSENIKNAMRNNHSNMIGVYQLDDNKNIIKFFPSIKAAAKEMKCQSALISRALKNKNKARGYYWIRK